ncbi:DUF2214 family protein [Cognatiyoonia sp. IB215446]|uniref:DUF2214 family protein n=1 Tax=Cognatiyoonia sp. IB215446 TaxID=3097355 RepID=UPI0039B75E33
MGLSPPATATIAVLWSSTRFRYSSGIYSAWLHALHYSGVSARDMRTLASIYGGAFFALLVLGLLRIYYDESGRHYHLENTVFWLKMGVFVLVATLSIWPKVYSVKICSRRQIFDGWVNLLMVIQTKQILHRQIRTVEGFENADTGAATVARSFAPTTQTTAAKWTTQATYAPRWNASSGTFPRCMTKRWLAAAATATTNPANRVSRMRRVGRGFSIISANPDCSR